MVLSFLSAVVFDMDGVLVDSEVHWRQVQADFLREIVPAWSEDLQHQILGMSVADVHAKLVKEHGLQLDFASYLGHYRGLAGNIYGKQCSMIPGVESLLSEVKQRGLAMALASSSPREWIRIVVDRFDLERFFSSVISAEDVGGLGKPDPAIYRAAIRSLNGVPNRTVAIEDSQKGIESALAAGATCVALRNGFNQQQKLAGATLVVDSFAALSVESLEALVS